MFWIIGFILLVFVIVGVIVYYNKRNRELGKIIDFIFDERKKNPDLNLNYVQYLFRSSIPTESLRKRCIEYFEDTLHHLTDAIASVKEEDLKKIGLFQYLWQIHGFIQAHIHTLKKEGIDNES